MLKSLVEGGSTASLLVQDEDPLFEPEVVDDSVEEHCPYRQSRIDRGVQTRLDDAWSEYISTRGERQLAGISV